MNYSENKTTTYGRKIIRNKRTNKVVIILCLVTLVLGFMVGRFLPREEAKAKIIYGTVEVNVPVKDEAPVYVKDKDFIPLDIPLDAEIQAYIYYLCEAYEMDFNFVMGLIKTESSFQVDIISKTNDFGLMQINKINHEWLSKKFGFDDYLDPYQNVQAGLYILRNLFEKYEKPNMVLMAYNMGETGARRLWEQEIFQSNYSNKVIENINVIERMNENE